jgi:hypothetical protein
LDAPHFRITTLVTTHSDTRAAWLAELKSTVPCDRSRAEAAAQRLYKAAGFDEPRFLVWFDSPCTAAWAVAVLIEESNRAIASLLSPSALSREELERLERTRSELMAHLGVSSWKDAVHAVGRPRVATLAMMPDPSQLFTTPLFEGRYDIAGDVSELFVVPGDEDDLARAESHLRGGNLGALKSALFCSTAAAGVIGNSFFNEYSFSSMADDERRVGERLPPPVLAAAWETGRSVGMIWPFENLAVMCDRPSELHMNDRHLLHNAEGPAIVYRDGWRLFAWNGKAVPERWIVEPQAVPARDYKGFDPSYRAFAESKGKPARSSRKGKAGSILKAALPVDHAARLELLNDHAGGQLPLFERYRGGEQRAVWAELVSLGAAVREEPHAADALAVSYETMVRVEQNVRTVCRRLADMGYVFEPGGSSGSGGTMVVGPGGTDVDLAGLMGGLEKAGMFGGLGKLAGLFGNITKAKVEATGRTAKPKNGVGHVPPRADAAKGVARFEKEFGAMPLSLRAFYEVVGEVNFIGSHPEIDPPNNPMAPDPLVVYGLDDGLVEFDDDGEEGVPSAITIAPDDLHKADTSGGDAYEMAIPDLRADGELLNERHNLFFVDYLRLVFAYGGFPGYEGRAFIPAAIASLKAGLLEF